MGDIVILDTKTHTQPSVTGDLWRAYCAAREKAEKTHDIVDGFAAGKAWAAFLSEFWKAQA